MNINKAPVIYWSDKLKCNYLQRFIIIHSILYYELNNSIISDKKFDRACKQLVEFAKITKDYNQTEYYYCFYDFTGETGFYLFDRLKKKDKKYLLNIANHVLKLYKGGGNEK